MNATSPLHDWTLDPAEAVQVQAALRQRLRLEWDGRPVQHTVAGVDASFGDDHVRAAIVVLSFPALELIETVTAAAPLEFPYVPGLLSFREGPAILAAWQRVQTRPDVVLFDGQGIAHPRRLGIAAHLGLWFETPTIGVAKSRLYGHHAAVGPQRGDRAALLGEGQPAQVVGMALRTRPGTRLLYVSPGHRIDVPHAVDLVLRCQTRYRLPEPTRRAHQAAGAWRLAAH